MKCLICEGGESKVLFGGLLLQCESCKFVFMNGSFVSAHSIYTEKYFTGEEYLNYVKEKFSLQKNFKKRIELIREKYKKRSFPFVLEIGCAYGFFGEVISGLMPQTKYTGIDIVEEPVAYGKKVLNQNLISGDYLSINFSEKFTDVFMWDVIEHLARPDLFLSKINSELVEGGNLYITTGDIDGLVPKIQRRKWRLIHPPSHIYYFSRKTLSQLLLKHGFRVKYVFYPSVARSVRQIFFSLFLINKKPSKLLMNIYNKIPENWSVSLNTFDIMFVVAEKSGNVKSQ